MGLLESMQNIANDAIDSRLKTMKGTVKSYHEGVVTVETDDGELENITCVNIPKIGTSCLLVPAYEEYMCIPTEVDDIAKIFALGLGKFNINRDGDLILELPIGVTNYFSIDDGDLIVDLDSATNEKFKIDSNGDVIYG